jgi:hypothetical protein
MKVVVNTKIGKDHVSIELPNMQSLHKFNAVYGALSQQCDKCGAGPESLMLSYKNPQGNDFFLWACQKCGAEANFGIKKDGSGLYWKNEKMKTWEAREPAPPDEPPTDPTAGYAQPPNMPPAPEDDLPF